MRVIGLLAICIVAVAGVPSNPQRIVGGSLTTIDQYPDMVALLYTFNWNTYWQSCGGVILNNRSIMTAAHCPKDDPTNRWRVRVGSTFANSGGVVHELSSILLHPAFDNWTFDSDIAILRTVNSIVYNNNVRPASIAGTNYNLADNEVVWAIGWGQTTFIGFPSEQLRHVQVWTINLDICAERYAVRGIDLTRNMLCSGWLDVGGRDQCQGDSGGPVYHNGVVVGVCSFGFQCALAQFPGVNTRVSSYTTWLQANA